MFLYNMICKNYTTILYCRHYVDKHSHDVIYTYYIKLAASMFFYTHKKPNKFTQSEREIRVYTFVIKLITSYLCREYIDQMTSFYYNKCINKQNKTFALR